MGQANNFRTTSAPVSGSKGSRNFAPAPPLQPKVAPRPVARQTKPQPPPTTHVVVRSSTSSLARPTERSLGTQKEADLPKMTPAQARLAQMKATGHPARCPCQSCLSSAKAHSPTAVTPTVATAAATSYTRNTSTTGPVLVVGGANPIAPLEFPACAGVLLTKEGESKPYLSKVVTHDFSYVEGPVSAESLNLKVGEYAFVRGKVHLYKNSEYVPADGVNLDGKVEAKQTIARDNLENLWIVRRKDGYHFFGRDWLVTPAANRAHRLFLSETAKAAAAAKIAEKKNTKEEVKDETPKPEAVFVAGKLLPIPEKITQEDIDKAEGVTVAGGIRHVHIALPGFPLTTDGRHPVYKLALPTRATPGDILTIGTNYLTPTVDADHLTALDNEVFGNEPIVMLYHNGKRLPWARGESAFYDGKAWVPSSPLLHVGNNL